jgi:hypothetical protein
MPRSVASSDLPRADEAILHAGVVVPNSMQRGNRQRYPFPHEIRHIRRGEIDGHAARHDGINR